VMSNAYTSTVVGPVQLVLGVLGAAAIATIGALSAAPPWITALTSLIVLITGVHLSIVRLSIGAGNVVIGQGPWNRRARVIPADVVLSATSEDLRWPQVFGVGVAFHRKTTRLTVRPGPTLSLSLQGNEHLRISTQDPDAARALLSAAREEHK
jgi:phosphotransferase system  glucose/maltose/N-acetylglucosamine-specific IIC component